MTHSADPYLRVCLSSISSCCWCYLAVEEPNYFLTTEGRDITSYKWPLVVGRNYPWPCVSVNPCQVTRKAWVLSISKQMSQVDFIFGWNSPDPCWMTCDDNVLSCSRPGLAGSDVARLSNYVSGWLLRWSVAASVTETSPRDTNDKHCCKNSLQNS